MPTNLMFRKTPLTRLAQSSPSPTTLVVLCVALGVLVAGAALARITPDQPVDWTVEISAP